MRRIFFLGKRFEASVRVLKGDGDGPGLGDGNGTRGGTHILHYILCISRHSIGRRGAEAYVAPYISWWQPLYWLGYGTFNTYGVAAVVARPAASAAASFRCITALPEGLQSPTAAGGRSSGGPGHIYIRRCLGGVWAVYIRCKSRLFPTLFPARPRFSAGKEKETEFPCLFLLQESLPF